MDKSSAMMPARSSRASRDHPATMSARVALNATARSGFCAASGAIATPVIKAIVDSGPDDKMRELPSTT